jgi:hypothetical protein
MAVRPGKPGWPPALGETMGSEPLDPALEMVRFFGRLMLLPAVAFTASLDALLQAVAQLQSSVEGVSADAGAASLRPSFPVAPAVPATPPVASIHPGPQMTAAEPESRRTKMRDRNLSDDMVKLVRFTILSIQRDEEHILQSGRGEKIVTDNMTEDSFSAWVISEYFQQPNHEQIADDDKKYLRVYFEVLDRWAKQDRKYEEKQLDSLAGIKDALQKIASREPQPAQP